MVSQGPMCITKLGFSSLSIYCKCSGQVGRGRQFCSPHKGVFPILAFFWTLILQLQLLPCNTLTNTTAPIWAHSCCLHFPDNITWDEEKADIWESVHNPRLVGVGRDLWGHQVQSLLKHSHLQQCAQDLVQVAFWSSSRRRSHSSAGQPVLGVFGSILLDAAPQQVLLALLKWLVAEELAGFLS